LSYFKIIKRYLAVICPDEQRTQLQNLIKKF